MNMHQRDEESFAVKIPLQDFYIDREVTTTGHPVTVVLARNQIRQECQRDWELLWDKNFIFAGCNSGIGSDIRRLEEIIEAAWARLDQYQEKEPAYAVKDDCETEESQ